MADSNIQNEIVEENNSIRNMLQEMPNLKTAQNENAMVISAIFIKEMKIIIEKKINDLRSEIKEFARSLFGNNYQEKIEEYNIDRIDKEGIILDYRNLLIEIANNYAEDFKGVLLMMMEYQSEELQLLIECKGLKQQKNEVKRSTFYKVYKFKENNMKNEIKLLLDIDMNEANKKLQELQQFSFGNPMNEKIQNIKLKINEIIKKQELIKKCEQKLEEIINKAKEELNNCNVYIDKSLITKNNSDGFFKKLFSFLYNKK